MIDTGVFSRDSQRLRQLAGAGSKIAVRARFRPPGPHDIQTFDRFQRANQHASRLAGRLRHDVHAVVHPVREINVSMARRAEDHARPVRDPGGGMRREIVAAEVRFRFHDDAGRWSVHRELCRADRALLRWFRVRKSCAAGSDSSRFPARERHRAPLRVDGADLVIDQPGFVRRFTNQFIGE